MRRSTLALALVAALAVPAAAEAVPRDRPWTTINVCDTDRRVNFVGVRAGMPGNGTRQRMRLRFELQWRGSSQRRWSRLGRPSKWVSAGSARFRLAQRGWTFPRILDPPAGERYVLRGLVRYQWRARRPRPGGRGRRVVIVRRAKRLTRGGLRGVEGGSPPRTSLARCVVDGPEPPPADAGPERPE